MAVARATVLEVRCRLHCTGGWLQLTSLCFSYTILCDRWRGGAGVGGRQCRAECTRAGAGRVGAGRRGTGRGADGGQSKCLLHTTLLSSSFWPVLLASKWYQRHRMPGQLLTLHYCTAKASNFLACLILSLSQTPTNSTPPPKSQPQLLTPISQFRELQIQI